MTAKPSQVNVGGNIIDDDNELASNFNNVFVNVGRTQRIQFQKSLIYLHLNF